MKRRSRKQWYQFHLSKAVRDAQSAIYAKYRQAIDEHESICKESKESLEIAKRNAPVLARISNFLGADTDYYIRYVRPCEADILVSHRALRDLYARREKELHEAEKEGERNYLAARAARQAEAEARAERVGQRKHERRVRYLEESPALRSAARVLKQLLIKEQAKEGEWVACYYCNCTIPVSESHLEHKRPLSRGGTNSMGNLVLSCAPCNLRKGRKTHEEFLRARV